MHNKAAIFATVLTTATLLSHSAWAFFGILDRATTFREHQKDSITPSYRGELPEGPPAYLYYNTREGEAWSRYYTRGDLQAVPYMQGSASMVMRPNGEGSMGAYGAGGRDGKGNMAHYGPDGRPAIGPDGRPVQGYDTLARRDMINKGRNQAEQGNVFIGEAGTYPPGLVEPGVWPGAERDLGVKSRVGKPKQSWNPRPYEEPVAPRPGDFDFGQQISSAGQAPRYDEGGNLPPFRQGYDGPADPYAARSPLPTTDDPNFGLSDETMRNAQNLPGTQRGDATVPHGGTPNYGGSQPRSPYDTAAGGMDGSMNQGAQSGQGSQHGGQHGNQQGGQGVPGYNNGQGAGVPGYNAGAGQQGGQGQVPPGYDGYNRNGAGNQGAHGQQGQGGAYGDNRLADPGRNPDGTYDKGSYTDEALGYSDAAPSHFPTPSGARVNVPQRQFSSSGAASSTNYSNLPNSYVVQPGDSLSGISDQEQIYGDWKLWPLIYDANRDQIDDPDLIFPDQNLGIPRDYNPQQRDSARQRGERKTAPYLFDDGQ